MKINSVTTTIYQIKGDELEEQYKSSFIEYDKDNNITCSIQFNADGDVESKTISEYDRNYLTKQYEYFSEDEIGEQSEYFRNEEGVVEKIIKNYADGSVSNILFERDGNRLTISTNDEDGELDEKEVMVFDEKKQLILKEIYDYNNKLQEKYENEYNENGKLIKQNESTSAGLYLLSSELIYDENGKVLKQLSYNMKGKLTHKLEFEYDEKGRVVAQQASNSYTTETEYNDNDNSQIEKRINAHGLVEMEKFTQFDRDGNILEEQEGLSVTKYEYEFFTED